MYHSVSDQRDYVGLDSEQDRLLLFAAEADLEESLCIRKSLLERCLAALLNMVNTCRTGCITVF